MLLARKGLVPTNIFLMKLNMDKVILRNNERPIDKFGSKDEVVKSRL